MIRTRDFILVMSVVLFVALVATTSVVRSVWNQSTTPDSSSQIFTAADFADYEAVADISEEIDRAAIRERLRALIANRDEEYIASEDTPPEEDATTVPSAQVESCAQPDDTIGRIGSWPLRNVSLVVAEGARLVRYEPEPSAPPLDVATTTVPVALPVRTIVQLPLSPTQNSSSSCVPSSVIGVTTTGWPLFNNSVAAYTTSGPETLIGYARDGFPIYGRYDGETDACGGYEHPSGYRYTVGTDRPFVLGCYQGTPQPFVLE